MRSTMRNRVPKTVKNLRREEGFAIPIVVGMGLIMILLATTAILRSQDDRVAAINKKATAQSLVAAESGVAQIQDFLNRYRGAAGYQACQTWANDTNGNCNDTTATATASWKISAGLPTTLNASCSAEADLATARATVASWAKGGSGDTTGGWRDVDSTDISKGKFRIVAYDGAGSLTVQGRVNLGQTGEATSELQVRLPIVDTRQEQVASLWAKTSISGNPQISSDAMGPCTGTMAATFPTGSDRAILRTRMQMPAVPPQPSTTSTPPTATTFHTLTNVSTIPGKELPRTIANGAATDDQADTNGAYKYIISSFDDSLKITPGKSVRIWVTGNINIQNKVIINQCSAAGAITDCGPFDLRIYGTSTSGTLTMNRGTSVCDAFFLLPTYSVTFNDTISSPAPAVQDCGGSTKNTGVYWINTWSGSSSTGITLDPPRATWSDAIVQVPPRIGPIQKWDPRTGS
jgi:Tfp pilus assembly protein PilX